jgi:chromosome partitioning protein
MYDERTNLSPRWRLICATSTVAGLSNGNSRNVRLAEAPSYGKPIISYDAHSKGAEAYSQLAREIIYESKSAGSGAGSSPVL